MNKDTLILYNDTVEENTDTLKKKISKIEKLDFHFIYIFYTI